MPEVLAYACGALATAGGNLTFNCSTNLPSFCNSSVHVQADYVRDLGSLGQLHI